MQISKLVHFMNLVMSYFLYDVPFPHLDVFNVLNSFLTFHQKGEYIYYSENNKLALSVKMYEMNDLGGKKYRQL